MSPDGKYKNEIDFIITNMPKQIENVDIINNLNFNTNHRMLRAEIKMTYGKKSRKHFKTPINKEIHLFSKEPKQEEKGYQTTTGSYYMDAESEKKDTWRARKNFC